MDDTDLDLDTYHELLSSPRRRAIIQYLDESESLEQGKLVDLVTADEVNKEPEKIDNDERGRVSVSLSQQHLDKLEDAGVIEHKQDTISQGENFDQLATGLKTDTKQQINLTIENATIEINCELGDLSGLEFSIDSV